MASSTSTKGEIAIIEGDNSIAMTNCTMTSGSSERGLLMMQSGSGDASGRHRQHRPFPDVGTLYHQQIIR